MNTLLHLWKNLTNSSLSFSNSETNPNMSKCCSVEVIADIDTELLHLEMIIKSIFTFLGKCILIRVGYTLKDCRYDTVCINILNFNKFCAFLLVISIENVVKILREQRSNLRFIILNCFLRYSHFCRNQCNYGLRSWYNSSRATIL